ncbi:MAG: Holliday junction branch migration DNA helicase RuvB [Candidatus Paceibacterota bacterium]
MVVKSNSNGADAPNSGSSELNSNESVKSDPVDPTPTEEDEELDSTLRPTEWDEYVGQEKVKENIKVIVKAAKKRGDPHLEHLLLYGGSGLGKTTLSHLIAEEMGANIKVTAGPSIERPGDLASILTNLEEGDVLFLDECHRINKMAEEVMYPAMEDFKLHLVLGRGPMAETKEIDLPKFTLVGATTRLALISAPLRNRFGATFRLGFYSQEEMEDIIRRSADILEVEIEEEAVVKIAERSRFTPRVANRLLKRVRDFAQVKGEGKIEADIAEKALTFLEIDEEGLEPGDRRILKAVVDKFDGGPVGLKTLAAATSEQERTILNIYEPYLIQRGFIERTNRGRIATEKSYEHLDEVDIDNRKLL